MVVQLPYDVWLEIAFFLDRDTLWSLRCMNSALREIALDVIYKTMTFSLKSLESTQDNGCFLRFRYVITNIKMVHLSRKDFLSDVYLAHRVQELEYYSGLDSAFAEEPFPTNAIQRYVREYFKSFSVSKLDRAIVETANKFMNVKSLDFRHLGNEVKSLRKSILVLNTTLDTCSHRLKTLVLQLPIAHLSEVLVPHLFIPNLISLHIAPNYSGMEKSNSLTRDVIATTIVPFLNRHRFTLTTLHLRLDPQGPPLYVGLDRIVLLKEFSMIISDFGQRQPISQFLQTHSKTLEKIHIITTEPTFLSLDHIFENVDSSFPVLQKFVAQHLGNPFPQDLDLDLGHGFMRAGECIRKSASSLVSLSILSAPMKNTDFLQILPPHTFKKLQELHISLVFITSQTLHFIENAVPNLKQLEIRAFTIQSSQNLPVQLQEEREFSRELTHADYSRWKLEHFKLLINAQSLSAPTVERPLYVLFAKAMRSLKTFNDVPVAEFISAGP